VPADGYLSANPPDADLIKPFAILKERPGKYVLPGLVAFTGGPVGTALAPKYARLGEWAALRRTTPVERCSRQLEHSAAQVDGLSDFWPGRLPGHSIPGDESFLFIDRRLSAAVPRNSEQLRDRERLGPNLFV
jgi:hypothetical protein